MGFEELLRKISPKLKGITHRLRSFCTHLGEDDLYQEAVIHLLRDHRRGKLSDKTESYILQGCYFHLRNYLRTQKYNILMVSLQDSADKDGREAAGLEKFLCSDPDSVRDQANVNIIIDQINNNGLTIREKEVFNLALVGLTTREIGSRLGVSHVRVVKLQKNIREKCKKHLDQPLP